MSGFCPDRIDYFEKKKLFLFIYLFISVAIVACLGLIGGAMSERLVSFFDLVQQQF